MLCAFSSLFTFSWLKSHLESNEELKWYAGDYCEKLALVEEQKLNMISWLAAIAPYEEE